MRILLLTPPMTQLNTPYPATAYLLGFLRGRGHAAVQADPAIELICHLFSVKGLTAIRDELQATWGVARGKSRRPSKMPPAVAHFLDHADAYLDTVEAVVRFLQGKDPSLALRLVAPGFLPVGPHTTAALASLEATGGDSADHLAWAFGALGTQDRAKYLATLYLDDLALLIREGIDARFAMSRYGERLAASAPSFDPMAAALAAPPTLVDRYVDAIAAELITAHRPDFIALTVPFPGNVYGALRIAAVARRLVPAAKLALGGGYVNTELRQLREPRLFDYVDYITLDDGARPLECAIEHAAGQRGDADLLRTFGRRGGEVIYFNSPTEHDVPLKDCGTPTYDGLPLDRYLSVLEMLNPMHRIWSDGRWNKLMLAHGCYWRRCNFCDLSLDYIGRYEEHTADRLVDQMLQMARETGQSGFHFVDEAAPPKVMLALANRLLARRVATTWWGNVRFEKTFALPRVAETLARAGCVAVSGGLEVASDRLLALMNKGVTVEQVARVTHALASAGILVHAYLMYGFPSQTVQETIDSLERVRQLFAAGCLHSAFWHRFSVTAHSPIGQNPAAYGLTLLPMDPPVFAHNDLDFSDATGIDHDQLGIGLRKAVYNYMHGIGLDEDVRFWFSEPVPKARVKKSLIAAAIGEGA